MGTELLSKTFIDHAREKTGLEDFGGRTFESGLDALVDSLNHDLDLSEMTAGYFGQIISQVLINRLEITQLLKEHPEIQDEKIESPLFIVGLPRSGTTLLHTLLALNPVARYLRNFETSGAICPPPELIPSSMDPRIQAYHDLMESFFSMAPTLRGINGLNFMANGTAECQNLMALEFVHMGWSTGSSLFSHGNWVGECNMAPAYRWHKRLLQILQWKLPNEHWVLKAPQHLFGLDHLLSAYPDARIVFTHRDPFEAMVSGVSMTVNWTRFSTQQTDVQAISDWYPALWAKGLKRALSARNNLKEDQILDIYHKDLSTDPEKVIETIYEHFQIPLSDTSRKRIKIWLRDNPRSRFGSHDLPVKEFGFIREKEHERFDFYISRFTH